MDYLQGSEVINYSMNFKHSHYLYQNKTGCYIFNFIYRELWMAGLLPGPEHTAGGKTQSPTSWSRKSDGHTEQVLDAVGPCTHTSNFIG